MTSLEERVKQEVNNYRIDDKNKPWYMTSAPLWLALGVIWGGAIAILCYSVNS